jgi:hydroxyacylglutathione hydrolase
MLVAILYEGDRLARGYPPLLRSKHEATPVPYDLRMLVERSLHPSWLSNAYLLAAGEGGQAVFVDSGAPLEPLVAAVESHRLTPTHLLLTHGHADHVAGNDELVERYGVEITAGPVETGGLRIEALATPGHSDDGVSFVVDGELCFTGDTLFRDAVGGGPAGELRQSVMEVLMKLPHETRVLPGHTDETTIGREWEENPFIRFWRGLEGEDGRPCRVLGEEATLVVWSPDYDGKGKALVRLAGGDEAIVGASRIEGL